MEINEIFESIQGEGSYAGYPTLFIRLSGCNRKCTWCDTKYHTKGSYYSLSTLKNIVNNSTTRMIVVTGGEPLLQLDELYDLISICKSKDWCLETNGDLITKKNIKKILDKFWYIAVSPKIVKTAKRCKKLFEKYFATTRWSAFKTRCDIKVVTDGNGGLNKNMFKYATCLMPLTTENPIINDKIRKEVWTLCTINDIIYCPRLHFELWGKRRRV